MSLLIGQHITYCGRNCKECNQNVSSGDFCHLREELTAVILHVEIINNKVNVIVKNRATTEFDVINIKRAKSF